MQNSNNREHYGHITTQRSNELHTAMVQVVLGMVRQKRWTGRYRLIVRYDRMKKAKGSGRSIIAVARALSEILWHMLTQNEPFDEAKMIDPKIRRKAVEMQAAAFDVVA
ncbi:hypothetical protein [Rectinema subterraneum]|nr:hypothetical protein [Rectinema subterraneum]